MAPRKNKNLVVAGSDLSEPATRAIISENEIAHVAKIVTYADGGDLDVTGFDWIYILMADGMNGTSLEERLVFFRNVEMQGRTARIVRVWG